MTHKKGQENKQKISEKNRESLIDRFCGGKQERMIEFLKTANYQAVYVLCQGSNMCSQALGSLQALPALTNVTCLSGLNSSSVDLTLFFTTFKNQFCSVTPLSVSCLMLLIYCPRLYCLFGTSFSDVWFQETERENYKHLFLVDFNCCCSSF